MDNFLNYLRPPKCPPPFCEPPPVLLRLGLLMLPRLPPPKVRLLPNELVLGVERGVKLLLWLLLLLFPKERLPPNTLERLSVLPNERLLLVEPFSLLLIPNGS